MLRRQSTSLFAKTYLSHQDDAVFPDHVDEPFGSAIYETAAAAFGPKILAVTEPTTLPREQAGLRQRRCRSAGCCFRVS